MGKSLIVLVVIMLGIGLVSGLLTYWRPPSLATPDELGAKGLTIIRRERVTFYGLFLPVLVGIIPYFCLLLNERQMTQHRRSCLSGARPGRGPGVHPPCRRCLSAAGFGEMTALHARYTAGFGWVMLRLLGG